MVRKLHYLIDEQHSGISIGAFLKEKEFSRAVLIELKKEMNGIIKNDVPAWVNETLQCGDSLDLCLTETVHSETIEPVDLKIDVLYEDEDLLIINKSANTPIHPSINNYHNTLANGVMYYLQQKNTPCPFRCINRLDRDTTGVTILAKNLLSAGILAKHVQEQKLQKTYIALVEGITQEKGTIDAPIGRMEGSIIKRIIDNKMGNPAITHYQRLQVLTIKGQPISMVQLSLETGRTHQIRVHMASIGHPLIGDFLYNENNTMMSRQALHVTECTFRHPLTGDLVKITAPLPKDMDLLILSTSNKSTY